MKVYVLLGLLMLTATMVYTQDAGASASAGDASASGNATAPAEANATAPAEANATAGNETAGGAAAGNETAGNASAGNETAGGAAGNETAGNATAGNETAGNETAGNATAGNETAGNATAGNETAGNATAGNETAGGGAAAGEVVNNETQGNETIGNETLQLSPSDAVLVLLNYQTGWMQEPSSGNSTPTAGAPTSGWHLADFQVNLNGLIQLANAFNLSAIVVSSLNQSYGELWSSVSNISNAINVSIDQAGVFAFNDPAFIEALNATGKTDIILAALTADSELVQNSLLAKASGYNVWPVLDSSPTYEQTDFYIALQNLEIANIPAKTFLGIGQLLLAQDPTKISEVNKIYQNYLTGAQINTTSSEAPSNSSSEVPPSSGESSGGSGGMRRFL